MEIQNEQILFESEKSEIDAYLESRGPVNDDDLVRISSLGSLEGILKRERKQRKKDFGKPAMIQKHYTNLCEIDDFLSIGSRYFQDLKDFCRDMQIHTLEEGSCERFAKVFPDLEDHLKFVLISGLYYFNNRVKLQRLNTLLKKGNVVEGLAGQLESYFRISQKNSDKIRVLVYRKKIGILNYSGLNSPETVRFFDEFYESLRNNSAEHFLNKYLNN